MKAFVITTALVAILFASSTIAAPSPKLPSVKNSRLFSRPPVQNYVAEPAYVSHAVLASDNSTSSPTTTAPFENVWISLTNDEAAGKTGSFFDVVCC
jgi:hypothetical protein